MAEVYAVTVTASFYVLANDAYEAERIGKEECRFREVEECMPYNCFPDIKTYRTPNQSPEQRARAINELPGSGRGEQQ